MIQVKKKKEKKIDFCGPENSPLLSALIPDSIFGIDIADCCEDHDDGYKEGGNEKKRRKVDKKFHKCLKCKFVSGVGFIRYYTRGFFVISYGYYKSVKEKGKEYFNYA